MFNSRLLLPKTRGFWPVQRRASILASLKKNPVIVSSNKDIYTNLALEQWLYSNITFTSSTEIASSEPNAFCTPVVLLWIDEPSVVIGRHQNPWTESNLGFINKAGIKLARRHSGGGCVYHDENNINISIVGPREHFEKRQENLRFLAGFLDETYGITCSPNKRHDLVHTQTGAKISGSAARLGRINSFHHFTLLVDTDEELLHTAIRPKPQHFITSHSSPSVRSRIVNLRELKKEITVDQVIGDLMSAYSKLYGSNKQAERVEKVAGDQAQFKDIEDYRTLLSSWDWMYGKTPKFKLEKVINFIIGEEETPFRLLVTINRGLFESIDILRDGVNEKSLKAKFDRLIGTKFTYHDAMVNVAQILKVDEENTLDTVGLDKLFATYLLQMIHECNFLMPDKHT